MRHLIPTRRTALKALHWGIIPFFVWFIFADPDALRRMGPRVFQFHSMMGLIFVTLALIWTAWMLRAGLLSRPGPKLQGWPRRLFRPLHLTLVWGLFLVAFGGLLLGLTASFQMKAGGIIPIGVPLNKPAAHHWIGLVHTYQFYALAAVVAFHAGFHIWRHLKLRDNALRIMAPRIFHRYL
ncbi:cytochrome b/b6 domain-containing protein [Pseudooctadecabacter jejudonensis]|uniref:Prokaryotic cytochrome b561 n=1 Tax=Pseudooctadecabacter jejudonensis TaxID=1391910 RepID=A0A1Y5RR89_9RHOB|nr:cytochrome b/b6 domain-containing protein [Pseudooctadecabacter jejudonensis]SLN23065.1 Prokaryotic cytochrome b561 [Pseudooctadecabacter jejudonensis]